MREVDFSDRTVAQRWREIKPNLREDLIPWTRHLLKRLLETSLEEELEVYLRAAPHERTEARCGHRNGVYRRDLTTELGLLQRLQVPRARTAGFQPQVFGRYARRQPGVNALLRSACISGVSTRQVGPLTALLLEDAVSASTVSRVTQTLDAEFRRFHARPLADRYCYLLLDGVRLAVKGPLGARKRVILCAYGLTPAGARELVSFRQVKAESEAAWTAFLTDLWQRGVVGTALRLVVTDGHPGLLAALELVYPFVPRQRCWVHKLRNVAAKLPRAVPHHVSRGGEADLPRPEPAGSHPGVPALGGALASGGARGGGVARARSRRPARLLHLSPSALAEDPDDERHRAGVPGGAPADTPDELLHQRAKL